MMFCIVVSSDARAETLDVHRVKALSQVFLSATERKFHPGDGIPD
jgi:hypothetical protein